MQSTYQQNFSHNTNNWNGSYYTDTKRPTPSNNFNQIQGLAKSNIRRVEPKYEKLSSDYKSSFYNQPNALAPIYFTQTKPIDGQEALNRIRKRVQESQRKRGYLIGGKPVDIISKPKVSFDHKAKPNITKILESSSEKTISKPVQTSLNRSKVHPSGLVLAAKIAAPPSKRRNHQAGVCQHNVDNKWATNYNQDYVNWPSKNMELKNKPLVNTAQVLEQVVEDKENVKIDENVIHHPQTQKMLNRKLMEDYKREENTKAHYDGNKSDNFNPLQHQINQANKSKDLTDNYTTSSASAYKRWSKSAFQTVTSRMNDRPYWANPNVGGHFTRKFPESIKVDKNDNLAVTISMKRNEASRKEANFDSNRRHNAFKTEYQRSFIY